MKNMIRGIALTEKLMEKHTAIQRMTKFIQQYNDEIAVINKELSRIKIYLTKEQLYEVNNYTIQLPNGKFL